MDFTDDDMQIERRIGDLIERGLKCYESGDMEGALAQWKHALALEPENPRAATYLEYVEEHHDLAGDPDQAIGESIVELAYPFGISTLGLSKLTDEELEDYESIEIVDFVAAGGSDKKPSGPSVDDGWNVDEGWVKDLVAKSEEAFTPAPLEPSASPSDAKHDISTLDLSLDIAGLSIPHGPSEDARPPTAADALELGGFDEDGEQDEEELTRARLENPPMAAGARGLDRNELELELEGDEEESTACHENSRRVGASTSAISNDASDLDLGDLGIGDASDESNRSLPDVPSSIPDAIDSIGFHDGKLGFAGDPVLVFDKGDKDLEKTNIRGGESPRTGLSRAETSDLDITRQHFAIDDEMTVDRTDRALPATHSRAPTQDPSISRESIDVDDALLSLQDSTREFDLGDIGLAFSGEEEETDATGELGLEELDIDIRGPSTPDVDSSIAAGNREFARHDSETAAIEGGVLATILQEAPQGDDGERTVFIVNRLIEHAGDEFSSDRRAEAAASVCNALDYAADSAVAQKTIFENERQLIQILVTSLGSAGNVPRLMCSLTEIPQEHINHRAAFLLTRLDEAMTLEELLDVSGMPRLEALRHLCGLHILNYLEVV